MSQKCSGVDPTKLYFSLFFNFCCKLECFFNMWKKCIHYKMIQLISEKQKKYSLAKKKSLVGSTTELLGKLFSPLKSNDPAKWCSLTFCYVFTHSYVCMSTLCTQQNNVTTRKKVSVCNAHQMIVKDMSLRFKIRCCCV